MQSPCGWSWPAPVNVWHWRRRNGDRVDRRRENMTHASEPRPPPTGHDIQSDGGNHVVVLRHGFRSTIHVHFDLLLVLRRQLGARYLSHVHQDAPRNGVRCDNDSRRRLRRRQSLIFNASPWPRLIRCLWSVLHSPSS